MAFVVVGHAITAGYGTDVPLRGQVATDPGFYVPLRVATNPLLSVAYSFHVPLFAFVSGYVLWHEVPRPVWTEIRKRAVGLLIPYLGWFPIVDGPSRYLRPHAREPFLKQLGSIVINPNNHHALWYLYALFVCSTAFALVELLPNRRKVVGWSIAAVVVLSMVPAMWNVRLFGVSKAIYIYPFVGLGYLASGRREWIAEHRSTIAPIAGVIFGVLAWVRYPYHVPEMSLIGKVESLGHALSAASPLAGVALADVAPALVRYTCAAAACVALLAAFTWLHGRTLDVQAFLGKRALGVYATHGMVLLAIARATHTRVWPLLLVGGFAVSLVASLVLERVPIAGGLLLGKGLGPASSETRV